jgi:two-component system, sensor histidine kinase PdtaS
VAEKSLQDSEARMRLATEATAIGIWEWNIITDNIHWDDQVFRIYGVAPTQDGFIPYSTWSECVLPEDLPHQEELLKEAIRHCGKSSRTFSIRRANDHEKRYIQAVETVRTNSQGKVEWLVGTNLDFTEHKNGSDRLKAALGEKEVLLKEVYHRVKNNLQVVSSLINLQAQNVNNEEAEALLKQSADRIKAMALIHEKLYQSKDLALINFNEYIRSLVDHLMFGYGTQSAKVNVSMSIENVFLGVDTAIPCGLIINELVSNALNHAFPGNRTGEIHITITQSEGKFKFIISDNGVGFPSNLDFKKSPSLGLQLINTLTHQLMGEMTLDQTKGSMFTLIFNPMTEEDN